jgi:hypothetical protein
MKLLVQSLALASLVTACGGVSGGGKKQKQKPTPVQTGPAPQINGQDVPVETFLVGGLSIPNRVKSEILELNFRSNIQDATFQCKLNEEEFETCNGGNSYTFQNLIHGRGYSLQVRARTLRGAVDNSPLSFEFLSDKITGDFPFENPSLNTQIDPTKMPVALQGMGKPDDKDVLENRSLQVGTATGVVVPKDMTVTSYSTTKTYSGVLRMIRLLGPHGGAAYQNVPCEQEWEVSLDLPSGKRYCDSRPTREQLRLSLPAHMPWNHLEMVTGSGESTDEKILVASFDDENDPTESMLGINFICQGSRTSGQSAVPMLNTFYGYKPDVEIFQWCQTRDEKGAYWWLGSFDAPLKNSPGSPRIRVIYSIAADRGIISGAQFTNHVGSIITKIVIPLTPID